MICRRVEEHRGLPGLPAMAYSQHFESQGWSVWMYGFLPHLNLALSCDSEEIAVRAAQEKWSEVLRKFPEYAARFPVNEVGRKE